MTEIKEQKKEHPKEELIERPFSDLKYSLYLGCVIPNRYPMIERATRFVFAKLGIELIDMNGATCCPAPGVFRSVDKALWLTLGARNLTIAQNNKTTELLTLCNGCFGTLHEVEHEMKSNPDINQRINKILAEKNIHFDGNVNVRQIMDVLYFDFGLERLKSLVKKTLNLRVAIHYGCHILKPATTQLFGQDPDNPTFFDEVVETIGCQSIDYREKLMCCGAGGSLRTGFKDNSLQYTIEKLRQIRKVGVDCIVVCCPFCHLQFDLGQIEVSKFLDDGEEEFRIPVIFITQLLGLAMGYEPEDLGMIKPEDLKGISPFVPFDKLLKKIESIPLDNQVQNIKPKAKPKKKTTTKGGKK